MIISLCPNPSLDVYYYVGALKEDDTNRVENPFLSPGGKGVNAARVISRFTEDVILALPLGGCTGECVKEILKAEGVSLVIVSISSPTRVNTILEQKAKGKHLLIASKGSPLSEEEREKLEFAVCKDYSPEVLILGGSVPPSLPKDYYAKIIRKFKGSSTKIIVDADGELLKEAVKEGPFAIKPNKYELERLVGSPLMDLKEIVEAAKEILKFGVEVVIVSLGEFGALGVSREEVFRVVPPKVEVKNTVGAGDSLVGAFAYGIYSGKSLKEAVKLGVACGTATVMEEGVRLCNPETLKGLLREVKVFSLV